MPRKKQEPKQELAEAKEKERLLEIERQEQAKKQAELDARQAEIEKEEKRIADEKRLADEKRIAEEKADQERRDKAMQAPDKEKLQAFAVELEALTESINLEVSSPKAKKNSSRYP